MDRIKRWVKSQLDRIPRRAYQIYLNGYAGYIVFDRAFLDTEIEYCEADDVIEIRRLWMSPAKLHTYPEFQGW